MINGWGRVFCSGLQVQSLGLIVRGLGFGAEDLRFRVQGFGRAWMGETATDTGEGERSIVWVEAGVTWGERSRFKIIGFRD